MPTTAKQTEWDNAYLYVSGQRTDYDYDIVGLRNSANLVFATIYNYVVNSTKVYRNGIRMTKGVGYDYTEIGTNQIMFTQAPDLGDLLIIDYTKI